MRFLKAVSVLGSLVVGTLAVPGVGVASPLASRAASAAPDAPRLVAKTQYYYGGPVYRSPRRAQYYGGPVYRPVRPIVHPHRSYRRAKIVRHYPVYRPRPAVRYSVVYPARPRYYRPVRVVRPYPVYRPVRVVRPQPRTVCTTRARVIRTAYGGFERRSVRRCVQRY